MDSPVQFGGTAAQLPKKAVARDHVVTIRTDKADTGRILISIRRKPTATSADFYLDPGEPIELGQKNGVYDASDIYLLNDGGNPHVYWSIP